MFKNREPRRYRPVNIFTDERQERIKKLVDEVRLQEGYKPEAGTGGTTSPTNGNACPTDGTTCSTGGNGVNNPGAGSNGNGTAKSASVDIEPDHFKGKFINYTPHLQRHKERSRRFGWPLWILLLFVMIILWRFLLR
ncbi:MAG: hypothetical protein K6F20_10835 [Bacteroidaceae bacterium]|nr:hypothetical protein [Bacteroidaceae bacterium]